MYLIIIGAGAITKQLIAIAMKQDHQVVVIEKNEARARTIMQEFDVRIFNADIAQGKILEEAGVERADAIIATTKDDSVNLMAMVLGKQYQVKNLISLLQEAEHQGMFEKLGIKVLSDPEKLIAQELYGYIDLKKKD